MKQTYLFTLTGFRLIASSARFAARFCHVRAAGSERLNHRKSPEPGCSRRWPRVALCPYTM